MSAPTPDQLQALKSLWEMALRDNGGANVCAKLLLGLYNGPRFPFDLTELRRLDATYMTFALRVIAMDWSPQREVQEHLNALYGRTDMGPRFELLACDWGIKGHCGEAAERELRARVSGRAAA